MTVAAVPEFSPKIPGGISRWQSAHAQNPTLQTKRLVLRLPVIADFPAYSDFVTSPRAIWMGGPHDAAKAWDWFCNDVAQWALLGLGGLTITLAGKPIGQVAVCHGPISAGSCLMPRTNAKATPPKPPPRCATGRLGRADCPPSSLTLTPRIPPRCGWPNVWAACRIRRPPPPAAWRP